VGGGAGAGAGGAPTVPRHMPIATTTTVARGGIVAPPVAVEPIARSGSNEVSSRLVSPILGSPIQSLATNTAIVALATKVVGNNVVLRIKAPVGATVYIYRNGVLVKTVTASRSASIKISGNAKGNSTFQVVVVNKTGKVSASIKKKVKVGKTGKVTKYQRSYNAKLRADLHS